MSNILEVPQQQAIQALVAKGWSVRRIASTLGINRRTVKRYAAAAPKCTAEVIAGSRSSCRAFHEVIAPMLELGLSAQRIYQDLVAGHGFGGSYPSVSRYVAKLKASEPERVWRIECEPGEELQVDFGLGAPLAGPDGKARRTWLFRAVLSHSRKGYSEVVLRQDTETFLRVIENAVRHFGGVPRLLNFDNLKAAVIKADWYDPAMNPKLADFCRHYGMTPMPCRSYTPQHKGKVERGVAYAKNNALKGRRFASLGEQNAHLLQWEEQVADKRVHGTTRRQVAAVFEEERKALGPLPASVYESYQEGRRRVQRDSFVEVAKAYYEAPPEFIGRQIWVRWDGRMVRLLDDRMEQIGCHVRLEPGRFSRCLGVRGFHGSVKEAPATGTRGPPPWARRPGAGRWARRALDARGAEAIRSIMGLCRLADKRRASDIDAACAKAMDAAVNLPAFRAIKHLLEAGDPTPGQLQMELRETDPIIRPLSTYTDLIRSRAPGDAPAFHPGTTPPTEPRSTSKAS